MQKQAAVSLVRGKLDAINAILPQGMSLRIVRIYDDRLRIKVVRPYVTMAPFVAIHEDESEQITALQEMLDSDLLHEVDGDTVKQISAVMFPIG
jgi:hypothetical protein